jgi:hypothetical protein
MMCPRKLHTEYCTETVSISLQKSNVQASDTNKTYFALVYVVCHYLSGSRWCVVTFLELGGNL